jgi:CheY-like chemotaxis protein
MNRRILVRQLAALRIEAVSVDDGFAAMAELERAFHQGKPFDLVVIDQMMPGLSGEALARRVRASREIGETKLIIASSAGHHGLAADTPVLVDAVLTKPVREQSLLDTFAHLFGVAEPPRKEPPQAPRRRRCRCHRFDAGCGSCSPKTTGSTSGWSRCCWARPTTMSKSPKTARWRSRRFARATSMSC